MTKTTHDVVTEALRRISVAAHDSPASSESFSLAKGIYEALYTELPSEGFTTLTDSNAVPDKAYLAIVQMTAGEIAPSFGRPAPQMSWREGLRRLRRIYMPDDRLDAADIDKDGTITAAEAQDDLEAQFF